MAKNRIGIIDMHTHIGDILYNANKTGKPKKGMLLSASEALDFKHVYLGGVNKLFSSLLSKELKECRSSLDDLSASMQENEIDISALVPVEPNVKTETTISASRLKSERFFSLASLNPGKSSEENIILLEKYVNEGCKGLKLHCAVQDINPNSGYLFVIMESFKQHNLPVLLHTGWLPIGTKEYQDVSAYHRLISNFPDVKFILAHMNMFNPDEAIYSAVKFGNVYLEPSWQPAGIIKRAVEGIERGVERVMFGSDFPYSSQTTPLNNIRKAVRDEKGRERILCENARELFNI